MQREGDHSYMIEKIVLCFVFFYTFLLWVGEYFFRKEYPDSLDEFFLLSHAGFFFMSMVLLRKESSQLKEIKLSLKTVFSYLSLILLFIGALYLKYKEKVIWFDENDQFLFSSHIVRSNIIERALHQQQPPLDYLLMGYAELFFGVTPFAVKFHSMLWGLGSLLITPSLLRSFYEKRQPSKAMAFLFVFCPMLVSFSLEGRPMALALFSSCYFLLFLGRYLLAGRDFSWLCLSSLLLLSSTSLQPQIFIFISFVLGAIIYRKKEGLKLLALGFAVALWRMPIDWRLIEIAKKQNSFTESIQSIQSPFESLIYQFKVFLLYQNEVHLLLIMAAFIFHVFFLFKSVEKRRLFIFFLPLCFIGLYSLIFTFGLNIPFYPRYVIMGLPCLMLFIYELIYSSERLGKRISLFFQVALIITSALFFTKPLESYSQFAFRPRWDKSYEYINGIIGKKDIVFQVAFAGLGDFRGHGHIGAIFYGNDLVKNSLLDYQKNRSWLSPNVVYYDPKRDYQKAVDKVILLINKFDQEKNFWEYDFPSLIEKKSFRGVDILVFKGGQTLHSSLLRVFNEILIKHGIIEKTMPFLEGIITMEIESGNLRSARGYIDRYKTIQFSNFRNEKGIRFKKVDEHQKRIRMFESLLKAKGEEN